MAFRRCTAHVENDKVAIPRPSGTASRRSRGFHVALLASLCGDDLENGARRLVSDPDSGPDAVPPGLTHPPVKACTKEGSFASPRDSQPVMATEGLPFVPTCSS